MSNALRTSRFPLSTMVARIGLALALAGGATTAVQAAQSLTYANYGKYNSTTYSFTAVADGDVMAYMIGGFGASYTNELSLMVNGKLTSAGFGLNNHTSSVGQSFDLGTVHAGDVLTFVLRNYTLKQDLYSDASMNTSYDNSGAPGHNHIYSTAYAGGNSSYAGTPAGTYVAFEDQRFPNSDYNYNDLSFVFTNVATQQASVSAVPEPESYAMMLGGLAALSLLRSRRRRS